MKKYRLRKRRVVADLISSAPHGLPISKKPPEPARACNRRPRQTESRSEVFVVRFDLAPHQELPWIEARKSRIRQHISRLPEVLIPQSQCQDQACRRLPIILKKIGLAQLSGAEHGY